MTLDQMKKAAQDSLACIERDAACQLTARQREVIRYWMVIGMVDAHNSAIEPCEQAVEAALAKIKEETKRATVAQIRAPSK